MLTIQQAQLAMNDVPGFAGSVKAIRTDVLVDKAAEELYPSWEKNQEQWKLVGGDHAYHYFGSAIWFNRLPILRAELPLCSIWKSSFRFLPRLTGFAGVGGARTSGG